MTKAYGGNNEVKEGNNLEQEDVEDCCSLMDANK